MTLSPHDDQLHTDEIASDAKLVQNLLHDQFPSLAELPIRKYPSAGTDNALFRLGPDLIVRVPRLPSAAEQIPKLHQWLPRLGPHLPLAVPSPIAIGRPGTAFPWHWSIFRWLEGRSATIEDLTGATRVAEQLGLFIKALHSLPAEGGPLPGSHNGFRGLGLGTRDAVTRTWMKSLPKSVDTAAVSLAWAQALAAPIWKGAPVWIHGDLLPGNLLFSNGELHAVIDFGMLGIGDPACDLMAAWTLFQHEARTRFREVVTADDATWSRARGWALSFAVIALPYYEHKQHPLADIAAHTIREVLYDLSAKSR